MTSPTPAGWYPDPDGSGGRRYWDGSGWTEHRSPAPAPEPALAGASVGSEEPTAVVDIPAEQRVGAHRKPEDPAPLPPPPVGPPPSFDSPPPAPGDRSLITKYIAACAALLAVLVLAIVYGAFLHDSDPIDVNASGVETAEADTPGEPTTAAEDAGPEDTDAPTTEPAPPPIGEAMVDGPLSFTLVDVETGTTVSSTEAPVEKTAVGEFIVVRLSVVNTSDAPAQFLGTFQTLVAGGTGYTIDDEATFYVGGGFVEIPPGAEAQVGVAYDVPPGTVPEYIELHSEPMSPGVQMPLS